MDKGAFRIVDERRLPPDANILGGEFVLAIKKVGIKDETHKALFVVQRHKDAEKYMIVYSSTSLKQQSIRLMILLLAIYGFRQ